MQKTSFTTCKNTKSCSSAPIRSIATQPTYVIHKTSNITCNELFPLMFDSEEDRDYQHGVLCSLAENLQCTSPQDWYRVTRTDVIAEGGRDIIQHYNNSLFKMLESIYPESHWHPWKFRCVTEDDEEGDIFWNDIRYQRAFLDWLGNQLGFQMQDDWYQVRKEDVVHRGGGCLLHYHQESLVDAISTVYFDAVWNRWKFVHEWNRSWGVEDQWQLIENVRETLGIRTEDEWYTVSTSQMIDCDANVKQVLSKYHQSLYFLLKTIYPAVHWLPWKFKYEPFLQEIDCHRQFFDFLADKEGLEGDDWHRVDMDTVLKHGGSAVLKYYRGSLVQALQTVFPTLSLEPCRSKSVQHSNSWKEGDSLAFCNWLAKHLNMKEPMDWYRLSRTDVENHGGKFLFNGVHGMLEVLESVYPDVQWLPWKCKDGVSPDFWLLEENQRRFFESLAVDRGILVVEDWYGVSGRETAESGKALLKNFYSSSLGKALESLYSEYQWHMWRFADFSVQGWEDVETQRHFFEFLAKECHVNVAKEWYRVTRADITNHGGKGLLTKYKGSIWNALRTVYPKLGVELKPWKFHMHRHKFWTSLELQREALSWLENKYMIRTVSDWYGITRHHILSQGAGALLQAHQGSLATVLRTHYAHEAWKATEWKLSIPDKTQRFVVHCLKNILPAKDVECNVTLPVSFKYSGTHARVQFDVWVPSLNLAIEYQGSQHYVDTDFVHGESGLEQQHERDREKEDLCASAGISLFSVPFWWNLDNSALLSLVSPRESVL